MARKVLCARLRTGSGWLGSDQARPLDLFAEVKVSENGTRVHRVIGHEDVFQLDVAVHDICSVPTG